MRFPRNIGFGILLLIMMTPIFFGESSNEITLDEEFVIYEDEIQAVINDIQFFVENQFSYEFNLVAETPELYPQSQTYWIAHDNLLAYHFLESRNHTLASKIKDEMYTLSIEFGLELNADNLPKTYKVDAIFNESIFYPMHTANVYDLKQNTDFILKTEISNGTGVFHDWQSYGDLIAYSLMELLRQGDVSNANNIFVDQHVPMWDGTGITDIARSGSDLYETYKIALFLLTGLKLNYFDKEDPLLLSVVQTLVHRQKSNGGIVTHFQPDGANPSPSSGVDANVETSITVAIALDYLIDEFDFSFKATSSSEEFTSQTADTVSSEDNSTSNDSPVLGILSSFLLIPTVRRNSHRKK
ncbi:MAG: hypothetical protein GPJ54_12255 [Candidatus Heimdallarchaeota archaeon]|nr:hypothetical protein [Candidatus Heimdallarchaeota archaeon]